MGLTINPGTPLPVPSVTTQSNSINVGTNPEALVVLVSAGSNNDLQNFVTITIDGTTIPYVTQGSFIGRNVYLFELMSPPAMSGSVTFQVALTGFFSNVVATPYALHGYGSGVVRDDLAIAAGAAIGAHAAIDTTLPTRALVTGKFDTSPKTPYSGTTELYDTSGGLHGYEDTDNSGARSVGWVVGGAGTTLGVAYRPLEPELGGGRNGILVRSRAGSIAYSGDLVLPSRHKSIRVGTRAGLLAFSAQRQIPLVGEGLDTPEFTVGGNEGDVLVQHASRPPSWEAPGTVVGASGSVWMPLTTEEGGQVNLVLDNNNSLVPTLVPLEDLD